MQGITSATVQYKPDAYTIWDKTGLATIAGFIYLRFAWQPAESDGYAYPYNSDSEKAEAIATALKFAEESSQGSPFADLQSPEQIREKFKQVLHGKHIPRIATIAKWANDPRGMQGVALDHYTYWRAK